MVQTDSTTASRRTSFPASCAVLFAFAAGVAVWVEAPLALWYLLTDGVVAAGVVAAAAGPGLWCVAALDRSGRWPVRWHLALGTGLGIGSLSLGVLIAGCCGMMSRPVWFAILIIMGVLTALAITRLSRRITRGRQSYWPALAMLASGLIPVTLMILVATVPPGVLWAEEAFGYDVLEYHLQVPKEYFEAGHIHALPHNTYSFFPMNAEMLSLLAMILRNDAIEAAILAKFINALLGVLFVWYAWLAGREFGRASGVACGALAATIPWLVYLSGVAYAENGMLAFGMLAMAIVCRMRSDSLSGLRMSGMAGLSAGLACGFKYTAVPMLAAPLALATAFLTPRQRAKSLAVFAIAAVVIFSPWLVRNIAVTGNPVFPLAVEVFGADDDIWTVELAERWASAHTLEDHSASRPALLWHRIIAEPRSGILLAALALIGLVTCRDTRWTIACWLVVVFQLIVWIAATHLFARFGVVLLVPMILLAGRLVERSGTPRVFAACAIGVAVVVSMVTSVRMYAAELRPNGVAIGIQGHTELFYEDCDTSNSPTAFVRQLPRDGHVLLVGEARAFYYPANIDYAVVFGRNPFAEYVATSPGDEAILNWLRERGYSHVIVVPAEIERLRRSYGFWDGVDAQLFDRLTGHGLNVVQEFQSPSGLVHTRCFEIVPHHIPN